MIVLNLSRRSAFHHDKRRNICPRSESHGRFVFLFRADCCQVDGINQLLPAPSSQPCCAVPPAAHCRGLACFWNPLICSYCKTRQIQCRASGYGAVTHQYLISYYSCLRRSPARVFSCLLGCLAPCVCACVRARWRR